MAQPDADARKWWILWAMAVIGGLILLDETVIGVALPTLRRDIGMAPVASHWVINAYLLVFAGFAAAGGKLGDVVGLGPAVLAGLALFGAGSLAAGFAEDPAWIIAARAVQGLGAAVIFPATLAAVSSVFPAAQRGMAIGILVAVGNAFLAAGPLVGGSLIEIFSWRWIFWINVPIVLVAGLAFFAFWKNPPRDEHRPAADGGGLALLVAGLGMLVFAVMQGPVWGWTRPVILALLAGGAVCLVLFVRVERGRAAPLIDVGLFRNPAFTAYNLVIFACQFSKMAVVVFGALYLQHVLKMSPLPAGLALLAAVVGSPILAAPAGHIADRYGTRWPALTGLTLLMLTTAWTGFATVWDSYLPLLPGFVLWGFALPFCFTGPMRSIMSAVPPDMHGQASGISMTTRLLGATTGIAICSTLYATTGSYRAVFFGTAALMLATLVYAFFAMDDRDRA